MPVKDRIVNWYIQNVIIPKREIIDKPGFIITAFTDKDQETYLRDLFLPERLFELIEKRLIEKYGDDGRQALYSAGKKNGYLYASLSNFPTIKNTTKKEFEEFAYLLVRFVEGTYASGAEHKIDIENKIFSIYFDDYIICRKNGHGFLMTDGGITGIWAYAIDDKSIEGAQLNCQGRGDAKCHVFCAPESLIKEKTNKFFTEKELTDQKFDEMYKTMNEIKKTNFSNNSLKDMLDAGFFEYKKGVLSYKNNRFFLCDSHLLYLLEQEIKNLEGGEQTLFESSYEFGKELQQIYDEDDYKKFIPDFFSALGFGDITFLDRDDKLASVYYPWTIFSDKSKFIIFRGIISGIVSNSTGKIINYTDYEVDIGSYLTLTIKQ